VRKIHITDSGENVLASLREAKRSEDFDLLLKLDKKIDSFLTSVFESSSSLSEPEVVFELSKHISKTNLFLASSRPIRDFQRFASTQSSEVDLYSNRGASGIDGNIATIAGIALATKQKTVGVIGDLAALHDLNSMSLLASEGLSPVLLVIINNDGGGIFSFLPVSQHHQIFEKYWGTPHGHKFQDFAKAFGLEYKKIRSKNELLASLKEFKSTLVLEIESNRTVNFDFHRQIVEKLKLHTEK